jgi:hypothetical protein
MSFDLFKGMFNVHPLGKYCLKEPSTQLFVQAGRKVKLITDAEGTYPVNLWRTIYVLASIHMYDEETAQCGDSIAAVFYKSLHPDSILDTADLIFDVIPDDEFVKFLEAVAEAIPISKMLEWSGIINDKLIITPERKEAVKNS